MTSEKRYLVILVALLMSVSMINIADKELMAPVVDAVKLDLQMNDTQVGAVRSSVFLAALLGMFFWGPLSDRWVRKYVIAIGAILWSAITWLTSLVTAFPQLLVARASMSFAEGCFNPSAYALITDAVPKKRHGLILGLMSLTYPVGTAMALVVVSVIGANLWRVPFRIYGIIGLILGVLVLLIVREPPRGASEEAVMAGEGMYAGRFSFQEFRLALRQRSLLLAFGLDACQASVNWGFAFWAPTYLTRYRIAPNPEVAALALLPAILGFVLGALLGGWMIDRLRRRSRLAPVWVALMAMGGGLVMALLVFNIFQLGALMAAAFFLGLVTYMVMPAVNIIMFSVVPPETKATTIATSNIILNLVVAVLSLLIGIMSDAAGLRLAFGSSVLGMYLLGVTVCLGLLATFGKDMAQRDALVEQRIVP